MKKYTFRLQTALDVRRQREEQLRVELAQTRARWQQEKDQLDALLGLHERCMRSISEKRTGRIETDESHAWERYLAVLEQTITEHRNLLDLLWQEIQQKIQDVVAATQETRALEKLRERHAEEHRRVELQEEQKFLDEIASTRSAKATAA